MSINKTKCEIKLETVENVPEFHNEIVKLVGILEKTDIPFEFILSEFHKNSYFIKIPQNDDFEISVASFNKDFCIMGGFLETYIPFVNDYSESYITAERAFEIIQAYWIIKHKGV